MPALEPVFDIRPCRKKTLAKPKHPLYNRRKQAKGNFAQGFPVILSIRKEWLPGGTGYGKGKEHILLHGMRQRDAQVGREVPRLRGMEHRGGAGGRPQDQRGRLRGWKERLSYCEGN
jgi:hypothetical protein